MPPEPASQLPALESRLLLVLLDERRKKKGRKALRARLSSDCARKPKKVQAALRVLADAGHVELETEAAAGGPIDLGRSRAARLTDTGLAYVLERLSVSGGCRTTGATINALLAAMREALAARAGGAAAPPGGAAAPLSAGAAAPLPAGAAAPLPAGAAARLVAGSSPAASDATPGPAPEPAPAPSSAPVPIPPASLAPPASPLSGLALDRAILGAFAAKERQEQGYVPIWSVRRAVGGASREAFDRALRDLQRRDLLYLIKLNDAREVAPDRVEDGLLDPIRGRLFFVARGERAWTSTSAS